MLIIKCINILSQTRKTEMETPSEDFLRSCCHAMSSSLLRFWGSKGMDRTFERRSLGYSIEDTMQASNRPLEENRNIGHWSENCRDWNLNTQFSGICVLTMENRNCSLTHFMTNIFSCYLKTNFTSRVVSVETKLYQPYKKVVFLSEMFLREKICANSSMNYARKK